MKFGFCLRTWGEKGGIGVYSRSLLEAMLALDSSNQYTLFYQERTHLGQFGHYGNVKEIYVPAPGKLVWDQLVVPFRAAREGVDILLHPKLAVPLLSNCKTVMVLHGTERFVYPQFSYRSDILYFKTIYPFYLRRATAIISVSENARKDVLRFLNIDPDKVRTIHLAPGAHFKKVDDESFLRSVREKYGLPARFLLNVGLIYPGKNIPNLLKALRLLRKDVDVKLVIVGTGRRMFREDLELIDDLELQDHVLLPGYIPHEDLVAVYNLADVLVFPSIYEGFGLPPLEAMACGTPVVCSNTGSLPEVVGDAALLIDPYDISSLAEAMRCALLDSGLRKNLVGKGFQNVKRFSWEKTARQTLDLFESLAASQNA
jgi:glycosyltransferase involved in cell wall biosynthesis